MIAIIPPSRTGIMDMINEERVLLSFFFVVAGAMYLISRGYPDNDAILPILASLAIMISILLLGIKSYVVSNFGENTEGSSRFSNIGGQDFDFGESGEDRISKLSKSAMVPRVILIVSYPVLGYLIGLLWATPIFVYAYMVLTNQSKITIIGYTVLSFLIVWVFDYMLNLPVRSGLLFGGL